MRARSILLVLALLTIPVLILVLLAPPMLAGTGIKAFIPSESYVEAGPLPWSYNSSFMVQNDGYLEHVYVVRVAVDDPSIITWVNISPTAFVLAPGEIKQVHFSVAIGEGQAPPGTYSLIFMPTMLPLRVEPYMDAFASYVSEIDRYHLTVQVPESLYPSEAGAAPAPGQMPVVFSDRQDRLNLIQYTAPTSDNRIVTQIDRAIRINLPSSVPVNEPVPVSMSVFEDLPSRGIDLMAISPDGEYYPIEGGNYTFDRQGKWGVVAFVGDTILLGRPVDVGPGGVRLVMPGLDSIMATVSLLLLLAVVPIWMTSRATVHADPYDAIAYKAYVIKKYIDQFDPQRLKLVVRQLADEYNDLVARHVAGRRKEASSALDELETLVRFELPHDC